MINVLHYPEYIAESYLILYNTDRDEYIQRLYEENEIPVIESDIDGNSVIVNFTDEVANRIHSHNKINSENINRLANILKAQCINENKWHVTFDRQKCIEILKMIIEQFEEKNEEDN